MQINACHDITAKQRPGPCTTITHHRVRLLVSASRTETCLIAEGWMERGLGEMLTLTAEDKQVQIGFCPVRYSLNHCCVGCSLIRTPGTDAALIRLPSSHFTPPHPSSPPSLPLPFPRVRGWRGKQNELRAEQVKSTPSTRCKRRNSRFILTTVF